MLTIISQVTYDENYTTSTFTIYNFSFTPTYNNNISESENIESFNNSFNQQQEKNDNLKLCGLKSTVVTQYILDQEDLCTICMNHYELDEKIINVICKHSFHMSCLSEWVKYKAVCPICRHHIKTE
jgi:hypothetical protein